MDANEAINIISRERKGAIVVSTMTPTRYWQDVSDSEHLDLPIYGAMGKASSVALGIALAKPNDKVIILDGDGGLLTNLGSVVTVADQSPKNLIHFVFEDGVYFTTGGQPIPGAGKVDFAGIARSSGIKESYSFDDLENFSIELPNIMKKEGPIFVCLKVKNSNYIPVATNKSTKDSSIKLRKILNSGD
ncbi:MAG: thiamine pyrophosphate-dependent enzyme [Dehalococcoidia bacterium]